MAMRVQELLDLKGNEVYSVSPEATIFDALQLMAEKEIGALVVIEGNKLVGIFSERDYARKVILKGKNSQETLVREVMTTEVISTSPKQKLKKCLSIMMKKHFRHMPVIDDDQVIGVLSIGDVRSKL
jgi:CBS domain-containing protein